MPINWMCPFFIGVPKRAVSIEPSFTAEMIAVLNSLIGKQGMLPSGIGSSLWKDGNRVVMPGLAKEVRRFPERAGQDRRHINTHYENRNA